MRIAIIGRTEILYKTAERLLARGHSIGLILTAKEAPEYITTAHDFEHLAQKINAPFIKTARIDEATKAIKAMPAMDIAVSLNYSGVIPQSVIDCFRLGILNAHGGDLPRYRGNACQAWAILNGEDRVGLCIHSMVGGELDSGNIITRDYYPLTINTKVTEVWNWMSLRIPTLFDDSISALDGDLNFRLMQQSKNPKDALRCYPRRPEDGRIDWTKSAVDVLRLINACNKPYAGAFCKYNGDKLIIWDARLVDDHEIYMAVPGQVTRVGDECIDVATAMGKLQINDVEFKGEVAKPSRFIRSIRNRLSRHNPL